MALSPPAPASTRNLRGLLLLSAAPALLGSVLLLSGAGAGRGLIFQQVVLFVVGSLLVLAPGGAPGTGRIWRQTGWGIFLAGLLFLPWLAGWGTGPQRWLALGGFRFYLAPVLLPWLLLWGGDGQRNPVVSSAAALLTLAALVTQPDAAQATAFAAAWIALRGFGANGVSLGARLGGGVLLAGLTACAWLRPDPLQPVDFVEGVFRLAARSGPLALAAAVAAAVLPATVLAALAQRRRSAPLSALAVYSLTLVLLAPLEITPVPLLGFGAGPIVGHLWVAFLAPAEAGTSEA